MPTPTRPAAPPRDPYAVTDAQIRALQTEAADAGDLLQAAICARAIGDPLDGYDLNDQETDQVMTMSPEAARDVCRDAIRRAAMARVDHATRPASRNSYTDNANGPLQPAAHTPAPIAPVTAAPTPGPWSVASPFDAKTWPRVVSPTGGMIAHTYPDRYHRECIQSAEERAANAALLAAAPALRDALAAFVEADESLPENRPWKMIDAFAAARALLASLPGGAR